MTKPRLGGWVRLWIVSSVMYAGFIAGITWLSFSDDTPRITKEELLGALPDGSRKLLRQAQTPPPRDPARPLWTQDPQVLQMADGIELLVPPDTTDAERDVFAKTMVLVVEKKRTEIRSTALRNAFVFWIVPCALIFLAGIAVRWVYLGFQERREGPP